MTDVEVEVEIEERPRSFDHGRSHSHNDSAELPMLESSRSSGDSSGSSRGGRLAVLPLLAVAGPSSSKSKPHQMGFARPRPEDEFGASFFTLF